MDYADEIEVLSKYQNVRRLVTSSDLSSHLQDLKLDGGEKIVSFQWLGPHFLTFLKFATEAYNHIHLRSFFKISILRFSDLLKLLDDSACECTSYGEAEHYKRFLEIIISIMPELNMFFTIKITDGYRNPIQESFIELLLETFGELLNCHENSSFLVSNHVKVLLEELGFPLTFLLDTMRCNEEEQSKFILKEIGDLFNELGLFLHSFFFTTDPVIATKMDLAISVLLEWIEIVKEEIKDHCIGSLQAADSPSEVSSSQDKSIPMIEEIIVGLEDAETQIASKLVGEPKGRQIISIVGMGGLGKTTLAKKVYNCKSVQYYFDKRSWCVVSQTYIKRKLLIDILSYVCNLDDNSHMKDEDLAECLYKNLKGIRYLIVMDDLWDKEAWDDLKRLFPDDTNGSRVLLTSRVKSLALEISHVIIEPPLLSPDESWNLLEKKVFKKECSPQNLQEIGKRIAANCKGLPLLVVLIAGVLLNKEKEESLWQEVAESLSSYISQEADNYIPTLELSYMHLPDHLKPCFLYLSAFPEDGEIPVRKLLLLWIAEGFIEKKKHKTLEEEAEDYLLELINRSLVQVSKRRSDNGVKSCTLHDLVHDMCSKLVVEDEKFLLQHQFLISKHRHRLCTDRFYHLSEALSILYNSKKIRILDAIHDDGIARMGIKIMPNLRYLEYPSIVSSIGKLQNLEVFVCHGFALPDIPTYLLNLPKLRHLHVKDLSVGPKRFSKNCESSRINSLQTLSYIFIDEEEILRCSPNLRKLKCKSQDNSCPDLNFLTHLESLTIYGNEFKGDSVLDFPWNIKKRMLADIRLPWRKMSLIGTLPNLEILKLKWFAFEGEIWNTEDNEFQKLKFLKLDHLNLEKWNSSYDHFPVLEQLVLRYCNELETIPSEFSYISTLQKIEVYLCGQKVESSALEIREEQWDYGNKEFDITIHGFFY